MLGARSQDAPEDVAAAALGLALVGLFGVFAVADAGFDPLVWLPGGLFAVGLLAVAIVGRPVIIDRVPRSTTVAIALFAAFAAWSFLSIVWADVRGIAWEGANRTLLYAVVYTLFAIWPWRARAAAAILGAFSVSIAAIGAAAVLWTARSDAPLGAFVGGLFSEPVGYHNANAALFLVAFWPALVLASRREVPPLARGLFLATAGLLLPLAVLPQSRGSLIAFPATLLVFFAIAPNRARCLLTLAPVVASTLLALGPLLDVYGPDGDREAAHALEAARDTIAPLVAALFVVGVLAALVERRIQTPPAVARVAGRCLGAAAVVGCVVGVSVLLPPDPAGRAADAWQEFKAGHKPDSGSSHFTSGFGSNRYDFWRVGLAEFTRAPLHGIGADNFAAPYVRERRSDEEPLYPHSVEVQVLSQTGLVGVALFLGFLVSAGFAAARARQLDPFGRAVAVAGVTPCVYWLGHGSGDWLWELPGLGAPALAGLGLAAGLTRAPPPAVRGRLARRIAVPGAVITIFVLLSFAAPWLAAREVDSATASWRRSPSLAFDRLERARRLDPLSERSDLVAGAIASRLGDWQRMRASFARARDRNPESWYAELELAVVDGLEGRRSAALAHLERARELNPRESAIAIVGLRLRSGRPIRPALLDQLLLGRFDARVRDSSEARNLRNDEFWPISKQGIGLPAIWVFWAAKGRERGICG